MGRYLDFHFYKKKMSLESLSKFASIAFFTVLCAKFYYLMGVTRWPTPDAPVGMILVRDFIVFGILLFFFAQIKLKFKEMNFFWTLWFAGLVISLYHLFEQKDLEIWAQHYFRNVLIPMLFYPMVYGLLKMRIKINLYKVLIGFFILDMLVTYAQVVLSLHPIRPPGVLGDPIINSLVLFWGVSSLLFVKRKYVFLLALIALIPLVQYLSSLSAVVSFLFAWLVLGFKNRDYVLDYLKVRENIKVLSLSLLALLTVFVVVNKTIKRDPQQGFEVVGSKAQLLYDSVFCKGQGCEHWSYEGRIQSNLKPFSFCATSLTSCVIGNVTSSHYERLESTWASLVFNWGAVFCLLYFLWIFKHLKYSKKTDDFSSEEARNRLLWSMIYYSCVYFQFLNTIHHKFPINIFFYSSMAYLMYFQSSSKEEANRKLD